MAKKWRWLWRFFMNAMYLCLAWQLIVCASCCAHLPNMNDAQEFSGRLVPSLLAGVAGIGAIVADFWFDRTS